MKTKGNWRVNLTRITCTAHQNEYEGLNAHLVRNFNWHLSAISRNILNNSSYFHEVTVVNENRIQFACRFSSLPSLRENRNELLWGYFTIALLQTAIQRMRILTNCGSSSSELNLFFKSSRLAVPTLTVIVQNCSTVSVNLITYWITVNELKWPLMDQYTWDISINGVAVWRNRTHPHTSIHTTTLATHTHTHTLTPSPPDSHDLIVMRVGTIESRAGQTKICFSTEQVFYMFDAIAIVMSVSFIILLWMFCPICVYWWLLCLPLSATCISCVVPNTIIVVAVVSQFCKSVQ